MSLSNITLKDYDNVVAVTQVAINQTMGEYLGHHPKDFALYGKDDGKGNVILVPDEQDATYIFSATLAPEQDANGIWINIVELKTQQGNQTVLYNVTLQNGVFKVPQYGIDIKQSSSDTPWIFQFFVNLNMQEMAKSELPDDLKPQLQNLDENIFSIQQLYLDLNTAALDTYKGIEMPAFLQGPLSSMLKQYLEQQQKQGKPLFGVTVKFKPVDVPPPTLTPTYVNFCVTPYHDADGNQNRPDLDTLNYLVMTDHNLPPAYPPTSFPFNWVEDRNIHGVMAIKRKPFADFIVKQLNPILKTLCPAMYCHADGRKSSPDDVVIKLNPGTDHSFVRSYNADTGVIASFSYSTSDSDKDTGPFYAPYEMRVSGNYSMTCNISLNGDRIKISGSISASASQYVHYASSHGSSSVEMPKTTFSWFVELRMYINTDNNGQLDVKIADHDFSSQPTVEKHDKSWWEKFLSSLSGFMQSYTNDLGDIRLQIQGVILGNVLDNLRTALENANHFVFPGAKTFAFKDPTFSANRDLASNITYLNPNAEDQFQLELANHKNHE